MELFTLLSGHDALYALAALILWNRKKIKKFFKKRWIRHCKVELNAHSFTYESEAMKNQ